MSDSFINLTEENLAQEHLCCIIRSKKPHPGVEAKRAWLRERLREGHVFRKLDAKGVVFIEYAPVETAWVPVEGENYLYIYCLWVNGDFKGKGYGQAADGILPDGCQGQEEIRRVHAGCGKAKDLALGPGLRGNVWVWNGGYHPGWLPAAGPLL